MAQSGFHGIIGLYGNEAYWQKKDWEPAEKKALKFGFVLGNIVPDLDLIPLVLLYLYNSKLALAMHRTFTHSLFTAAAVYLFFYFRRQRGLAVGLAAGMILHSLVDILVWFSGVELFWPLNLLGWPVSVNLWTHYQPPEIVSSLLGAADYLAYGLYFTYLGQLALRQERCLDFLPRLNLYRWLQWILTIIFVVLAFLVRLSLFNIIHYALFTLIMMPLAIYATFKLRPVIEEM